MLSGKAPAATLSDFKGIERAVPVSLVVVENPSWTAPADIGDGWLHHNIQVACHLRIQNFIRYFNGLRGKLELYLDEV
jgi:hypothetical protein